MLIVQTIRIHCLKYETHPWEIIQKLDLGDIARQAVPLEDQTSPQELVQADLAVEPSDIPRVRGLCQLVEIE
jgi:hypothetical protein